MFIRPIRFPLGDGVIVAALKSALHTKWGATGFTVTPKLPAVNTRRMVTVRDDSGPQDGRNARRRYGINVWADSAEDAKNIALDVLSIAHVLPDGLTVTATDSFTGPYEIEDDPAYVVDGKQLIHYYCAFRASIKGSTP